MLALRKNRKNLLLKLLKEARLTANLRQLDVANSLSKPQSYIAKIESGERKIDFIEVLDICKQIKLDPKNLVDLLS
jgi:transcriptional regulator with XRE-family HTH domain